MHLDEFIGITPIKRAQMVKIRPLTLRVEGYRTARKESLRAWVFPAHPSLTKYGHGQLQEHL